MNKNVFTKKKIDTDTYVNIETGELLSSSNPNLTSINEVNPNLEIISSTDYLIIDSKALAFLIEHFNNADLANIIKISNMVKGNYNVVYNEKIPHTKTSLQEELDYSVNKFNQFIKRLFNKGIISYLVCFNPKANHKEKYIVLNPNLCRKSKVFRKETLDLFRQFNLK